MSGRSVYVLAFTMFCNRARKLRTLFAVSLSVVLTLTLYTVKTNIQPNGRTEHGLLQTRGGYPNPPGKFVSTLLAGVATVRTETDDNRDRHSGCIDNQTMSKLCREQYRLLRDCPPVLPHGRNPLRNFYLSLESNSDKYDNTLKNELVSRLVPYRNASIGFVHIPKSGGTSVESFLKSKVSWIKNRTRNDTLSFLAHCNEFQRAALHGGAGTERKAYISKRAFGIHKYVYPYREFLYLVWFRNPITRVVSTYYYLKEHKCFGRKGVCTSVLLPSTDLGDFLRSMHRRPWVYFDNYATRLMLFGEFPDIDANNEDCCDGEATMDSPAPGIEENHYQQARENLVNLMGYVGILEDWGPSQEMLSYLLDIPYEKEIHANSNSHKSNLSDFETNELERRNVWDLKLYEDAKKIYERQKAVYSKKIGIL